MILGPTGSPARHYLAFSGGSYTGASRSRRALKSWNPVEDDANSALIYDLPTLRARSFDLCRNSPLGIGAINTTVTNVIGAGLKLQSMIDREFLGITEDEAEAWQRHTEREWALFALTKDLDLASLHNFPELTDLFFRSTLAGGDCFAVLPSVPRRSSEYRTRVQLIEAPRVTNPDNKPDSDTLVAGIERTPDGAPLWYYIENRNPQSRISSKKHGWKKIRAFGQRTGRRNVIHGFTPFRVGQSRGLPFLTPVIEHLKQISRLTEYELMGSLVSSLATVFLEQSQEAAPGMPVTPTGDGVTQPQELAMGHGSIIGLGPGEKVHMANPTRPNANFDPFWIAIVREIGTGLEIPYEILVKHFTASYSASRAAFMMAWKFFMARRAWCVWNFCRPLYELFLIEAVTLGRITAPGFLSDALIRQAYMGSEWIGPAKGQIDELKEGQAAKLHVDEGWKTDQQVTSEISGGDWDKNITRRATEIRKKAESGATAAPSFSTEDDQDPDREDELEEQER